MSTLDQFSNPRCWHTKKSHNKDMECNAELRDSSKEQPHWKNRGTKVTSQYCSVCKKNLPSDICCLISIVSTLDRFSNLCQHRKIRHRDIQDSTEVSTSNKKQPHRKNRVISAEKPSLEGPSGCGLNPEGHPRAQADNVGDPTATKRRRRGATRSPLLHLLSLQRKKGRKTCKNVYKDSDSVWSWALF
jgi:hypothetical protein